jgi:hypothetical protein
MVVKLEMGDARSEIPATPFDHPAVDVHAEVAARPRILQQELTCETTTSASEIEDGLIQIGREVGVDEPARWIVVRRIVQWSNELPHLRRRHRNRPAEPTSLFGCDLVAK